MDFLDMVTQRCDIGLRNIVLKVMINHFAIYCTKLRRIEIIIGLGLRNGEAFKGVNRSHRNSRGCNTPETSVGVYKTILSV